MKRIILTGGGSAGHVYPVIEIAKVLKKNHRLKLLYVGQKNGLEKHLAKAEEIPFRGLITGKRRAYFSLNNFIDIFKTTYGLIQAFFIFCFFKPNLVFAKGGFVTFPIIFWARRFKTPLIIHESDAVMGRANLWASKTAQKICLGFPIKYFFKFNKNQIPLSKLVYCGIPLRKEFMQSAHKEEEEKLKPIILFTGGSQGASKINQLLLEILPELLKKYIVFHLAGHHDFDHFNKKEIKNKDYYLYDFSEDMSRLMQKADLIISRAGANTLAEISALSKPSILIPLPTSASEHQKINAKIFEDANAAVVLNEKNLTSGALLSIINRLIEDKELKKLLGHHAHEFTIEHATSIICDVIYEAI